MKRPVMMMLALSVLAAASANAAVTGGSNIGLTNYPAPSCTKPETIPQPTDKPKDNKDKALVDAFNAKVQIYNSKVAGYNVAMHAFNACMATYVDSANNDIMRIKQAVDAAQLSTH